MCFRSKLLQCTCSYQYPSSCLSMFLFLSLFLCTWITGTRHSVYMYDNSLFWSFLSFWQSLLLKKIFLNCMFRIFLAHTQTLTGFSLSKTSLQTITALALASAVSSQWNSGTLHICNYLTSKRIWSDVCFHSSSSALTELPNSTGYRGKGFKEGVHTDASN